MLRTLHLAARSLARRPGFSAVTILTYGLGIGACAVVFSMVNALLLRPLPFGPASERLVTLHSTHPTQAQDWDDSLLSAADYLDFRASSRTLEAMGAFVSRNFALATEDATERVQGGSVTASLFPMIAARPILGRGFHEDDAAPFGHESVVLLSYGLWQKRFGGDPWVVGRSLHLNGRALTVVGVMAPGFRFPERQDVWVPLRLDPGGARANRSLFTLAVRRPEASARAVQAELDGLASRLGEAHPASNRGWGVRLFPFRDFAVSPAARVMTGALLAAVLFVLAVAGANVAGLLLARAAERRRELALRASLGATRVRLVGEMVAENGLLALAGGALGCLVAVWGLDAFASSFPEDLPYWIQMSLDGRVLGFILTLMVAVGVGVAIVPALRATRGELLAGLTEAARGATESAGTLRGQWTLIAGQVALSLTLLVGAQLLIRSFLAMDRADGGFDVSRLVTLRVYLAGDAYDPPSAKAAFFREATERLRALPGVADAAATSAIPTDDGGHAARAVVEGRPVAPGEEQGVTVVGITPTFHATLGAPLLAGRSFTSEEEAPDGPAAAIVSRALAERLFPRGDALSRRIGLVDDAGTAWHTVVGIAPPVHFEEFGDETTTSALNVFLPYGRLGWRGMAFIVRTEGEPATAAGSIRTTLRGLDPGVATFDLRTMREVRGFTTFEQRLFAEMLGSFAVVAVFLAALGIYGLVAYGVGRRTREIGIRMALGARAAQVLGLLTSQALAAAAVGLVVGLGLALGTARALQSALFGVQAFEALAFAGLGLLLLAVAGVASLIPARRALRIDPARALRAD